MNSVKKAKGWRKRQIYEFNPDWMCTCGDLTALGVVHRQDGPCYYPDKREWVGLTNEEIFDIHKQVDSMQYLIFGKAIEDKLKAKNFA